jgi:hypothetical protein
MSLTSPTRLSGTGSGRRGRPRPQGLMAALHAGNRGRLLSAEHRGKISEAVRRRGIRPPKAGPAWSPKRDALLGTMPDEEVTRRTGRTLAAVVCRRCVLRVTKFGRRGRWFAKG